LVCARAACRYLPCSSLPAYFTVPQFQTQHLVAAPRLLPTRFVCENAHTRLCHTAARQRALGSDRTTLVPCYSVALPLGLRFFTLPAHLHTYVHRRFAAHTSILPSEPTAWFAALPRACRYRRFQPCGYVWFALCCGRYLSRLYPYARLPVPTVLLLPYTRAACYGTPRTHYIHFYLLVACRTFGSTRLFCVRVYLISAGCAAPFCGCSPSGCCATRFVSFMPLVCHCHAFCRRVPRHRVWFATGSTPAHRATAAAVPGRRDVVTRLRCVHSAPRLPVAFCIYPALLFATASRSSAYRCYLYRNTPKGERRLGTFYLFAPLPPNNCCLAAARRSDSYHRHRFFFSFSPYLPHYHLLRAITAACISRMRLTSPLPFTYPLPLIARFRTGAPVMPTCQF